MGLQVAKFNLFSDVVLDILTPYRARLDLKSYPLEPPMGLHLQLMQPDTAFPLNHTTFSPVALTSYPDLLAGKPGIPHPP